MTEASFSKAWALEQLEGALVPIAVGNRVVALIEAYTAHTELKNPKQRELVLDLFLKLAKGEALVADDIDWVPADAGFTISIGETVRVAPNAFQGTLGRIHNGRLARVVARRWGNIIIDSIDGKTPEIRGGHYPPDSLQVRRQK